MAPKRFRGESSRSFDSQKFISSAAQERYNSHILRRNAVKERGIDMDRIASIFCNIRDRGWEKFTKHPDAAILPVVREFYANAPEHRDHQVYVRGKWVSCDRTAINRYYGLPNIAQDQYSAFLTQENRWDTVLQFLALPETTWKTIEGNVSSFTAKALDRDSKTWHYFVGAKLMPVTHFSDVHRDRAALIYAIKKKFPLDVGRIVHTEILRCTRSTTLRLYFPSMITGLCRAAGVAWEPNEELVPPLSILDFNHYFHMQDRTGQPRGARARSQAPPPPAPPESSAPASSSTEDPLIYLQQQFTSAQRDIQRTRREVQRVRNSLSYLELRQHQWEQYQANFHGAMAQTMVLLADSAGIDPSNWPNFPQWAPSAPHPDEDIDDDGDEEADAEADFGEDD